jgi:hypothetical protein
MRVSEDWNESYGVTRTVSGSSLEGDWDGDREGDAVAEWDASDCDSSLSELGFESESPVRSIESRRVLLVLRFDIDGLDFDMDSEEARFLSVLLVFVIAPDAALRFDLFGRGGENDGRARFVGAMIVDQ